MNSNSAYRGSGEIHHPAGVSPSNLIATPTGPSLGVTDCSDAAGAEKGPAVGCVIELSIKTHTNGELRATIAHEVFHAFQAVMSGTVANFNRPGNDWLIEGSAQWVESELISQDRGARIEWRRYLRSPATTLFTREYSAIGFFGHMASSGISPWTRFAMMFAATDSPAAWLAGVGGEEDYLDSEASAFFREPGLGPAWDERGPNVPFEHGSELPSTHRDDHEHHSAAQADGQAIRRHAIQARAKAPLQTRTARGSVRQLGRRADSLDGRGQRRCRC